MKNKLQTTRILQRLTLLLTAAGITLAASAGPGRAPTPGDLPILPMPRHAEPGGKIVDFHPGALPQWIGLDKAAIRRLQPHWEKIRSIAASQDYPQSAQSAAQIKSRAASNPSSQPLRAGILGKDPSFDALVARLAPSWRDSIGNQGYILLLDGSRPFIAANTDTGIFYGIQSLKQLLRAHWDQAVLIADWPSFGCRTIYDDISRGPISTVNYIKQQIDRMAEIKINYLSFYIEHVVQPLSHPDFAPADGRLTIAQIKELSGYASRSYMQLIGSFQSFGHFEKILSLPAYAAMGATNTLISPTNPKARDFLRDVIGELCDAFNAPWFNVNCDETFDLGQGLTKPYVDSMGAAAFYAAHLRFLDTVVRSHGKKMMVWGDFMIQHPETFDLLPKDITYLTWEYGDQSSFDTWIKPFATRNLPFMVCPGILNTYRMFPDMNMAKANIRGFTEQGLQAGASGVITTIWDDGGAYLFSGDWYGVYLAAESSWSHPGPGSGSSFDNRYELNAYGARDDNYVHALSTLMRLKKLPLTYNLTDGIWHQKLLPDSGKKLIINNQSADSALALLDKATRLLSGERPARNASDIRTLSYTIDQYKLIIRSRLAITAIANQYDTAASGAPGQSRSDAQSATLLAACIRRIDSLGQQYRRLHDRFRSAWLEENQPYWLNKALAPYDEKISQLDQLAANLTAAREKVLAQKPLPPADVIRLAIRESPYYYFQNWMLAGPFITDNTTGFPAFLYADNAAYDKPPSAGDFTTYKERMFRWQKFFSGDGGIIDLDEFSGSRKGSVIYAYCLVNCDTTTTTQAFTSGNASLEIFCNGKKCDGAGPAFSLPLRPGANHILLKLRKQDTAYSTFTFRLDPSIKFTNHKYKYQLNGKSKLYTAD